MASLSGQNPASTFQSLIKTINNNPVSGSLIQLSDGNGTALPISVSTVNVSISSPLTASIVAATDNGNGTNFKIGDDAWIGDVNLSNTLQVKGQQDSTKGYIKLSDFVAGPVIGATSSSILELTGSLNVSSSITSTISAFNPTLINSNGVVIKGGNSLVRLTDNTGIWADGVQSSYLQFSGSYGRYVSILGGVAGTDSIIQRLQVASQYTQFVTSSINNTPVPTHLVEVLGGDLYVTNTISGSIVSANNNGNGTNFQVGDDAWIGDVNITNTLQIKGQQDGTKGYIKFSNFTTGPILGAASSSILELTGSLNATGNLTANNLNLATAVIVAANATSSLSATSPRVQVVTGTTNQTIQLPNATTLATGSIFYINNNTTSGSILVKNGAGFFFNNVPWGGNTEYVLLSNSTAAGTWDSHAYLPSGTSWGHDGLNFQGTITATTTADNQVTATFNGASATQTADLLNVYNYPGGTKVAYITAAGNLTATSFTGSLYGTASIATSASYVATASIATSASYATNASTATNASIADVAVNATLADNATSASYASNATSASYATSTFTAISSSYALSSSQTVSSSYALTASYALNVPTQSVSSSYALSSSQATLAETASISNIQYVTNSANLALGQIQVLDYSDTVSTSYVNGLLTLVFGTPAIPSALAESFNGTFLVDRFNQVLDNYTVSTSWNNGGYTLISASIYEGATQLANTGVGTTLNYTATTSGSHTYVLQVTSSSPLDQSVNRQSTSLTGTISKTNPGTPTLSVTPTIQLGTTSNQIEQGATGSISFTSGSGASNGWVFAYEATNVQSPYIVTGSLTGSTSLSITATANYSSSGVNGSDNNPALTTATTTTTTYSKIRSLRSGATLTSSYTQNQLEDLGSWDITLGGSVGSIKKGTANPTGQSVTINWTGSLYHYIVYDSAYANLTAINSSGFNVSASFALTTAGSYKVYKSTLLQTGNAGTTITYTLI
jgi:hypothetical protein